MQYIFTLLISFAPLIFTIYLSRKYQLADKDRPIVEKQFEIYNKLYLNIVHNQLNEPISIDKARTNIQALISELYRSEMLYNYLSPTLYQLLITLSPITNSKIGDIRLQIVIDFENIKYRLGYPCRNKFNNKIIYTLILLISLFYMLVKLMTSRVDSNIPNHENINYIFYSLSIIVFIPFSFSIIFITKNISYIMSWISSFKIITIFKSIIPKNKKAKE